MKRSFVLMTTMLLLALAACQPGATPTTAPAPAPTATTLSEATPPTPTATSVPPTPTATPVSEATPTLTGSGGGRIVFSSRRGEGDYEVYVMNADGTDKRQVTRDAVESEEPDWSPDGTQIAYNIDNYAGHCDVYVINADGTNKRRLTTEGNAGSSDWSPSGTQIAFSLHARGSGDDLFLMNADGTDQQRLTNTGRSQEISGASWSPDGTHIVCVVDANPEPLAEELTICVFNVQDALQKGGATVADMRALPRAGESTNDRPAWSPTGSQIAFSAVVNDRRDIYVVNADGTDLRQLTHTPDFNEHAPAWSPDGTQIAFQSDRDANWDIYVMNADGSNRRRLTTDVANDVTPDWAP